MAMDQKFLDSKEREDEKKLQKIHISKKKKLGCGPRTAGLNPELTKTGSQYRGTSLSILQTCIK